MVAQLSVREFREHDAGQSAMLDSQLYSNLRMVGGLILAASELAFRLLRQQTFTTRDAVTCMPPWGHWTTPRGDSWLALATGRCQKGSGGVVVRWMGDCRPPSTSDDVIWGEDPARESACDTEAMRKLTTIQEMQVAERADWLRKTWGIEIRSANPGSGYPMDILRKEEPIGRIVRSGNLVVLELPGIDELNGDKACGPNALELWEYRGFEIGPGADRDAERINAVIYYSVGAWAERQGPGTT